MRKFWHALYQPYKWLFVIPMVFLMTLIFGIIAATLAIVFNPKIASFIGGVIWSRLLLYITPIRVRVSGRNHIDPAQSYVIICNHQSQYDILVLYAYLGVDFRWVMKQELRDIPGLGIGCEKIGHIFIDRSNREAALASINSARKTITGGTSVLFFPEGTRRADGTLGEFKKGAFHMALDMGLPILPVTIVGTRIVLPPRTWDLMPGTVSMTFHPPIDTSSYTLETLPDLVTEAHDLFVKNLPAE